MALDRMRERDAYPPEFLEALEVIRLGWARDEIRLVPLTELKAGMITNANVYSKSGLLILGAGQEITASVLGRLMTFGATTGIVEPISVRMAGPAALEPKGETGETPVPPLGDPAEAHELR